MYRAAFTNILNTLPIILAHHLLLSSILDSLLLNKRHESVEVILNTEAPNFFKFLCSHALCAEFIYLF